MIIDDDRRAIFSLMVFVLFRLLLIRGDAFIYIFSVDGFAVHIYEYVCFRGAWCMLHTRCLYFISPWCVGNGLLHQYVVDMRLFSFFTFRLDWTAQGIVKCGVCDWVGAIAPNGTSCNLCCVCCFFLSVSSAYHVCIGCSALGIFNAHIYMQQHTYVEHTYRRNYATGLWSDQPNENRGKSVALPTNPTQPRVAH